MRALKLIYAVALIIVINLISCGANGNYIKINNYRLNSKIIARWGDMRIVIENYKLVIYNDPFRSLRLNEIDMPYKILDYKGITDKDNDKIFNLPIIYENGISHFLSLFRIYYDKDNKILVNKIWEKITEANKIIIEQGYFETKKFAKFIGCQNESLKNLYIYNLNDGNFLIDLKFERMTKLVWKWVNGSKQCNKIVGYDGDDVLVIENENKISKHQIKGNITKSIFITNPNETEILWFIYLFNGEILYCIDIDEGFEIISQISIKEIESSFSPDCVLITKDNIIWISWKWLNNKLLPTKYIIDNRKMKPVIAFKNRIKCRPRIYYECFMFTDDYQYIVYTIDCESLKQSTPKIIKKIYDKIPGMVIDLDIIGKDYHDNPKILFITTEGIYQTSYK